MQEPSVINKTLWILILIISKQVTPNSLSIVSQAINTRLILAFCRLGPNKKSTYKTDGEENNILKHL